MGRDNQRGGRGASRGGRGGRGPSRRTTTTETKEKLSTAAPELKDHIFYINKPDQAHNFIESKKQLLWYLNKELKDGGVMMQALEDEKDFSETEPKPIETDAKGDPVLDAEGNVKLKQIDKSTFEGYKFDVEHKEWREKNTAYKKNKVTTCGIILNQCTKAVHTKLEAKVEWNEIRMDPIKLMKAIKAITQDSEDEKYHMQSVLTLLKRVVNSHQLENESLSLYAKRFKTNVDLLETKFGKLNMEECCENDPKYKTADVNTQEQMKKGAYDRFLALTFMKGSTSQKAKELGRKCNNEYNKGINSYPETVDQAHHMIHHHALEGTPQQPNKKKQASEDGGTQGAVFTEVQLRGLTAGKDGNVHPKVTCHKCNKKGHYKNQCPAEGQTRQQGSANANAGSDATQGGGTQSQSGRQTSDQSQSGVSVITNEDGNTTEQGTTSANIRTGVNLSMLGSPQSNRLVQEANTTMKKAAKLAASNMNLEQKMRFWILLDNQSTDHIFCNKAFLHDIRLSNETLELLSNGGKLTTSQTGQFEQFKERVWYHEKGVTNILSFARVRALGYKIEYDYEADCFTVSSPRGKVVFQATQEGLYAYKVNNPAESTGVVLLNSVEENKKRFSKRQIARADRAKDLYETIGFTSMRDFETIVKMNGIRNNPVVSEDIRIMKEIYGDYNVFALKGKATRSKPKVVRRDYINVPKELKLKFENIELCIDIMYVQGLAFLVGVSKHIHLFTVKWIPNRKKLTLAEAIDETLRIYNKAGFLITDVHCDTEFKCLEKEMSDDENHNIRMHWVARNQHVPEIERGIRTMKERIRSMWHAMVYARIPKVMIKLLVYRQVKWLNSFPPKGGISAYYSPRTIMGGTPIDYETHCKFNFGAYVQAEYLSDPTNTMEERTKDAIYLDTLDGPQGGYECMNLRTGRIITAYKLYELPVTDLVKARVEELARQDKVPTKLTFVDPRKKVPDDEDDGEIPDLDDASIAGVDEVDEVEPLHPETIELELHEDDELFHMANEEDGSGIDEPYVIDLTGEEDDDEYYATKDMLQQGSEADQRPIIKQEVIKQEEEYPADSMQELRAAEAEMDATLEATMQEFREEAERPRREVQPVDRLQPSTVPGEFAKGQSYSQGSCHLLTQGMKPDMEYDRTESIVMARTMISMVQTYSLKAGIKKFGDKAVKAAAKEMTQLHERNCFKPVDVRTLTEQERKKALESLIFLTEKRDGNIKVRACANGSKQRQWMTKEDTSSPTVSLPAVLATAVIDAYEGREVAVIDIPNAFVQTENVGEVVHMKIRGEMALILVQLFSEYYKDYLTEENGTPVLYVQVLKALYGLLQSSLLYYKKFVKDIEEIGFKLNPYDPCVANKMVDGKQLTLTWHVDDVKASHVNAKVIDDLVEWCQKKYGGVTKVTPSRGKKHDYLAIGLDYSTPGVVKIDMTGYVKSMVEDFKYPEELGNKVPKTPAAAHLFEVRDNAEKLDAEKAEEFHHVVAKGLFLCKRARDDIQPTIAFLTTRVKEPDQDDWNKLLRLLRFLKATQNVVKTLEISNLGIVQWWADAAFGVHIDMKSHTGGVMSMGKGAVQSISQKQKLNTKSSTEAELVGADDVMIHLMWMKNFLEAQGYGVKQTILYQDNTSAMLLEKNGKESSGKRTRHINIRYFYIKDRIEKGDVEIKYCPTDEMVADYMSKPLQGKPFRKFFRFIMNIKQGEPYYNVITK